jgi:soluble cytochrome b562
VWNREGLALVRTNRPDQAALQEQLRSSAGNQLNESRSAVIENYRRTAESIEATTARARESTATYSTAISDYRTVKELHEHFKREAQRGSEDRAEISADRAESIRTDYLRKFFTNYSRELESTATKAFERFSTEFTDRESSQKFNSEQFAEFGENRDRKPIKPMTEQVIKRMSSVEQYQQKLAELIQQVSSRL